MSDYDEAKREADLNEIEFEEVQRVCEKVIYKKNRCNHTKELIASMEKLSNLDEQWTLLLKEQPDDSTERDAKIRDIADACNALWKSYRYRVESCSTLTWDEVRVDSARVSECNKIHDKLVLKLQKHTARYARACTKHPEDTHAQIESRFDAANNERLRIAELVGSGRSTCKRVKIRLDKKRNKLDELKRQRKALAAELESLIGTN
jgi:chromosome segregation ATPase